MPSLHAEFFSAVLHGTVAMLIRVRICIVIFKLCYLITFRDRTVYIQYSKHQELKTQQVTTVINKCYTLLCV
jgi:hypothetical protein